MKTRLFPAIVAAITLFSLITSFILLRNNQNEREKFEAFLLENFRKVDVPISKEENKSLDEPQMNAFQDFLQTVDPKEHRVPVERLHQAYRDLREPQGNSGLKAGNPLQWNIVPSNMGGRTRVVMYDPNTSTGNKVWAGAVTGGLWYNNNITSPISSWIPVNDFWPSLAISSITFDPNNTQTFYVGTGEAFTARVIYRESSGIGEGIFKSTDGGQSWQQLQSTLNWKFVTDIEVRDENGTSVIYAGVASGEYHGTQQSEPTDGLYRSTNGGANWTQVMPNISGTNNPYAVADIEITANNRIMVGSMANLNGEGGATILYSDQGIIGTWTIFDDYLAIIEANPYLYIPNRVMIGCAPSDPDIAYALLDAGYVNSDNGFIYTQGLYILRTDNACSTWTAKSIPTGGDYYWATIGWHALTLGVDPNNADALYIGGLDVYKSTDGGNNWTQVSDWRGMYYGGGDTYVHADIHDIDYKPGSSDELLVTTDGGVFYTAEAELIAPAFQEKNLGYGTLQFYSCAIHSTAGSQKYVGGLQDNGTLYHTGTPLTIFDMIDGGDGAYCFIDQNQPQYMITSVYYNQYTLFNNGNYYESMSDWSSGTFISAADYDYNSNVLYANACSFGGSQANQLLRISGIPNNISGTFINLNTGLNVYYSAVEYSPHSPLNTATIYAGSLSGRLFRVTNAQAIPQVTEITGNDFPEGAISSIAIGGSDDTLLVTFSNYGISSVWQTYDGGGNWEEKETNLPDIPIRWALYHPNSTRHAMMATELGIWTTSNLDEAGTVWAQDIEGFANVRVDMLQMRLSDYTVITATHGRGLATAVWDIQTGTGEPEASLDVSIYPNPTSGQFKVQSSKGKVEVIKVEIVDLNGKVVSVLFEGRWGSEMMEFDVSYLPAGVYFCRIQSGNQTVTRKILLIRVPLT
ncbi:MAG: T9SS type A sorting domain-containing protein [Bacteroidales bacterium]|nr:T9SS type A sorting domain-containing protein [Bacteroidales bacterium]